MPFDPLSPPAPSPPPDGPPRPSWRLPRAGVSVGVAAGLALSGAGIAFAASSVTSSHTAASPTTSTTTPGPKVKPRLPGMSAGPQGGLGRKFGAGMGLGLGLGQVVHGTATVPNGNGGYKTVELQVGNVSAVSSSSITVASSDGYSHTYTVVSSTVVDAQAGGIGSVSKGDQVRVLAETVSGKDTAVDLQDITKVGSSRSGFGFGPMKRPAKPQTSPQTKPANATAFGQFSA